MNTEQVDRIRDAISTNDQTKFKLHPACAASPGMSDSQYKSLQEDIASYGLIEPISLFKGMVIDGRHRLKACNELGIEPETIDCGDLIEHGGDPWAFVWSTMQHKNPTIEQLGFFAVEREKAHAGPAKERQKRKPKSVVAPGPQQNGKSRDKAGKEFGISGRTVSRCKAIIEKGCPQLIQATKDSRISIKLAEKVAKSIDKNKQQEIVAVAMVSDKPEKTLRESIAQKSPSKNFDRTKEADSLADGLRKKLDSWPKSELSLALGVIHSVMQEYRQ